MPPKPDRALAIVAFALGSACASSAPSAGLEPQPQPQPVTVSAPPPPASTVKAEPEPVPVPAPTFALVFKGIAGAAIDPVGSSAMIRHFNTGWSKVYRYDGQAVTDASALLNGLAATPRDPKPWLTVERFVGSYPDGLRVSIQLRNGRQFYPAEYEQKNGKWVYASYGAGGAEYNRAANKDAVITQDALPNGEAVYELVENGKIAIAIERAGVVTRRLLPSSEGAAPGCATTIVQHDYLFGASDGSVFGIGPRCEKGDERPKPYAKHPGAPLVERWSKGETNSTMRALPADAGCSWGAFEVEGGSIWALCGKKTALFDGQSWREVTDPGKPLKWAASKSAAQVVVTADKTFRWNEKWEEIGDAPGGMPKWAAVGPDGTVWAIRNGKLFRLTSGAKKYEEIALPVVDGKAASVIEGRWSAAGEMFLTGDHYILSDRFRGSAFVATEADRG